MSTDNENNPNTLSKEFSDLAEHFLPENLLVKGIETLSSMKENVVELDGALLELAKSSNYSAAELKAVTEEAFRLGESAGKAGTDVLSYITSASKLGYSMKDSLAMTEEALKMNHISTGIDDAETAMEHLKNILDGFEKDTDFAPHINDAIKGLSQTEGIDFDTLAEGASKLAKSAGDAGLSFEQMLGLLTGAYSALGDMDLVSNGGLAMFSGLEKFYGNADNLYNTLEHLNSVWKTLDDSSKDSFAASNVGEGQTEVFAALMNNWADVEQAVYSASNSFGVAETANADHMDSIAGKTAVFQNALQELSSTLLDSGILKFFLDLGTTGVDTLNTLTKQLGSLSTIATLSAGYFSSKGVG